MTDTSDSADTVEPATGSDLTPAADTTPDIVGVRRGSFGASGSGDTSGFGGLVEPIVWPAAAFRPFGEPFDEMTDEMELALADRGLPATDAIERIVIDRGEITYYVRREHLVPFVTMLRDEPGLRFEFCSGVNGVHYPEQTGRELHAVYPFLSITHNRRIRVEVTCPNGDAHIPSIVSVYPTNDWHERETYDFFGIEFDGHPALTRIEMPDDWVGHPQRKDYALNGIPVEYKGATIPPPDQRRSYN